MEWDRSSPLTPLGQMVYFIEFLKVSGRLDALIDNCPLTYTSPNAPNVRDVIGTWVLSVLAGHKRYAHITALRCDSVLPELMGMSKIASDDSVRRALLAMPEHIGAIRNASDPVVFPIVPDGHGDHIRYSFSLAAQEAHHA